MAEIESLVRLKDNISGPVMSVYSRLEGVTMGVVREAGLDDDMTVKAGAYVLVEVAKHFVDHGKVDDLSVLISTDHHSFKVGESLLQALIKREPGTEEVKFETGKRLPCVIPELEILMQADRYPLN